MAELLRYRKRGSSFTSEYDMEDVQDPQDPQDPDEQEQIEEGGRHVPECKLCGDTDTSNFIDGNVCQCTGSIYTVVSNFINYFNTSCHGSFCIDCTWYRECSVS